MKSLCFRRGAACVALPLLALVPLERSWGVTNCAIIERLQGDVEVLRLKEETPEKSEEVRVITKATKGMRLLCSDIVVTGRGARVKLQVRGRGVMALGPLARLEIETYRSRSKSSTNTLKLLYGKVRAFVEKEDERAVDKKKVENSGKDLSDYRLRITTPSAVVGVRGTDFYVSHDPNTAVTEQATISGEVEVQRAGGTQKIQVLSGQQVSVVHLPEDIKSAEPRKPLNVVPIAPQVLDEIRQTSAHVQSDQVFITQKAVDLLGDPKKWTAPPDELPVDLKDIKEEF